MWSTTVLPALLAGSLFAQAPAPERRVFLKPAEQKKDVPWAPRSRRW